MSVDASLDDFVTLVHAIVSHAILGKLIMSRKVALFEVILPRNVTLVRVILSR